MADEAGPGSMADAVGAAVDDAAPSQYVKLMSRAVWNQISGGPRHRRDDLHLRDGVAIPRHGRDVVHVTTSFTG